jgi:hypothetical protein
VITFPLVVVVKQPANVRSGPGTAYPVISGARPGQRLTVYGCNHDCTWYLLAEDCWIVAFLVRPEQPVITSGSAPLPTTDAWLPTVVVSIPIPVGDNAPQSTLCPQTLATINTYAGPATFYAVVGTLPAGECVAVIGRNSLGDWFQLSHGMWILAASILYAEPIETMPIVDRIFTATPEPTPTPVPTATPTPTPTALVYNEILTVGEWIAAVPDHRAVTAAIWTHRYFSAGLITGNADSFAASLIACVDNTLRTTAEILGPGYPAQPVADGCVLVLN